VFCTVTTKSLTGLMLSRHHAELDSVRWSLSFALIQLSTVLLEIVLVRPLSNSFGLFIVKDRRRMPMVMLTRFLHLILRQQRCWENNYPDRLEDKRNQTKKMRICCKWVAIPRQIAMKNY